MFLEIGLQISIVEASKTNNTGELIACSPSWWNRSFRYEVTGIWWCKHRATRTQNSSKIYLLSLRDELLEFMALKGFWVYARGWS